MAWKHVKLAKILRLQCFYCYFDTESHEIEILNYPRHLNLKITVAEILQFAIVEN